MRKLFVPALALLVLTYAMLAQAQRGGGPPTMPPEPGSLPRASIREGRRRGVLRDRDRLDHDRQQRRRHRERRRRACSSIPESPPAAATTFIADVKTLTNKPIKYVVDTHYHYDHAFGNQVFGPDVTIIGHDTTRRRLNGPGSLKAAHVPHEQHGGDREPLHAAEAADLGSEGSDRSARSTSGSSPFISSTPTSSRSSSRRRRTRRCRAT